MSEIQITLNDPDAAREARHEAIRLAVGVAPTR